MLKIAMVMADFTGSEAEELRRALSFHRSQERMNKVCVKLRAAHGAKRRRAGSDRARSCKSIAVVRALRISGVARDQLRDPRLCAAVVLKVHRAPEFYAAC